MTSLGSATTHRSSEAVHSLLGGAGRASSRPWFRRLARAGLVARSVIYVLLAYFALDIAVSDSSPAPASGEGALAQTAKQSGGKILLVLLAVGLAGYGLWRLAQAAGHEDPGRRTVTLWKRLGWLAVAVMYFVLCADAVSLITGSGGVSTSGGPASQPEPFVATVLRWPGGPLWVGFVGVGIAVGGLVLAVWGAAHDYGKVLDTRRMSRRSLLAARLTGIAGEVTRGLLAVLVAVYLITAAVTDDPEHAKSLDSALRSFDRLPIGPPLLGLAALGLACFALYSVFESAYRSV